MGKWLGRRCARIIKNTRNPTYFVWSTHKTSQFTLPFFFPLLFKHNWHLHWEIICNGQLLPSNIETSPPGYTDLPGTCNILILWTPLTPVLSSSNDTGLGCYVRTLHSMKVADTTCSLVWLHPSSCMVLRLCHWSIANISSCIVWNAMTYGQVCQKW